jgi:hypothetical protein
VLALARRTSPPALSAPQDDHLAYLYTQYVPRGASTLTRNGFSFENATAIWVKRLFTQHEIFGRNLRRPPRRNFLLCIKIVKLFYSSLPFLTPQGKENIRVSVSSNSTRLVLHHETLTKLACYCHIPNENKRLVEVARSRPITQAVAHAGLAASFTGRTEWITLNFCR